jgi:glycosyltransferase involved in cell wall biosynthesis
MRTRATIQQARAGERSAKPARGTVHRFVIEVAGVSSYLRVVPDVVLPVLNEAEALPWVIARVPVGFRAIVVDNGSTDGSGELAAQLGVEVISQRQPGFGAACWAGLLAAEARVVCFMDCDGSLDPRELPRVAGPVVEGEADLVLGARQASGPGAWPLHARIANRALALQLRRRAGLRLHDIGPMRAARRESLLALGLVDRRFGWPLEMVLRAAGAGWRIDEVSVTYGPRRGGRSKVSGSLMGTLAAARDSARALARAGA